MQDKKDSPFPLGSFELEKRRCVNAPLRIGTLSAENDIMFGCWLSFCGGLLEGYKASQAGSPNQGINEPIKDDVYEMAGHRVRKRKGQVSEGKTAQYLHQTVKPGLYRLPECLTRHLSAVHTAVVPKQYPSETCLSCHPASHTRAVVVPSIAPSASKHGRTPVIKGPSHTAVPTLYTLHTYMPTPRTYMQHAAYLHAARCSPNCRAWRCITAECTAHVHKRR